MKRPITPPCHGGDRRFESGRARQVDILSFVCYYIKVNALFICNGNVARSQEASIFFNDLTGPSHQSSSAGVNANKLGGMDPPVEYVLAELGYLMTESYRKGIAQEQVASSDIIVSFKPPEELPELVRQHPNVRYWEVADPKGQSLEFHRGVRDQILMLTTGLISELSAK